MLKKITIGLYLLSILFCGTALARIAPGKYHDYRASSQSLELLNMQEYHLQQAQIKIAKLEFIHAWGDLAYVLCHVPNHHQALQHMIQIAPKLQKQAELREFLHKALDIFPEDAVVQALANEI